MQRLEQPSKALTSKLHQSTQSPMTTQTWGFIRMRCVHSIYDIYSTSQKFGHIFDWFYIYIYIHYHESYMKDEMRTSITMSFCVFC